MSIVPSTKLSISAPSPAIESRAPLSQLPNASKAALLVSTALVTSPNLSSNAIKKPFKEVVEEVEGNFDFF